jgi:hypothetical protein
MLRLSLKHLSLHLRLSLSLGLGLKGHELLQLCGVGSSILVPCGRSCHVHFGLLLLLLELHPMGLLLLHQKLHVCLLLLHCTLAVLLTCDQALRSTRLGQAPLTLEWRHGTARGLREAAHHTMRHTTWLVGLLLLLLFMVMHHCLIPGEP